MTAVLIAIFIILLASVVHSSAGFGYSIITMMFFPLFFSVPESIVLKTFSGIVLVISIVVRYRKEIDFRMLAWPLILAVPGAVYGVIGVTSIDNGLAMKFLGSSLILLSGYFYFLSGNIKIPGNKWSAMIGGGISGLMGGFLGVPGPPIVLYYSVVIKKKEAYMATIQTFFLCIDIICLTFLTKEMTFTREIVLLMPVALVTSIGGMFIGGALFRRMSSEMLHKMIYMLMFLSGFYYLVK